MLTRTLSKGNLHKLLSAFERKTICQKFRSPDVDAVYTPTLDAYLSRLVPGVKTVDKDFARAARFSLQLYEHDVKFPFARLFGGRKNRDKFNFFSESELGC